MTSFQSGNCPQKFQLSRRKAWQVRHDFRRKGRFDKLKARVSSAVTETLERRQLLSAFLTPTVAPVALSTGTNKTAYDLTDVGTSDWAHWTDTDSDGTDAVMVDKSSGDGQILNLTPIDGGNAGNYGVFNEGQEALLAWTDGPDSPDLNYDTTKIYQNNSVSSAMDDAGWTFQVPADTTGRTLYILAGSSSAQTTINASLSDSSASPYTDNEGVADTLIRNLYQIDYAAASSSQHLTITLTKTGNLGSDPNGSLDLIAVWLVNDVAPAAPSAPSDLHAMTVSGTQVDLTWTDNSNNEDGFNINYSTSSDFSSFTALVAGPDTGSKWVTGLTAGEPYYFEVQATNASLGDSDYSDSAVAVTPADDPTIVNVLDYGADSTGGSDSTDAINDAIANHSSPGDIIYFPAGTYKVDERILPEGEGRIYMGQTTLTTNSDGTTTVTDGTYLISTSTDSDSSKRAFFYIHENDLGASYNGKFDNLTFEGEGIFADTEEGSPIEGVVVTDCHFIVTYFSGNNNNGIEFTTGLQDSSIINNVFNIGGGNGIYGYYWYNLAITNNEFDDKISGPSVANEGIHLTDFGNISNNLLLEQNYFSGLGRIGVELQGGGTDNIVQDNYYTYSGEEGYDNDTAAFGITMPDSVDPIVRRNYAVMDQRSGGSSDFVNYIYELGGENLDAYDNYSSGGNDIEVNGANGSGIVQNNQFVDNYEMSGDNTDNGAHATITNNGPDVQLTWDTNRPIPGPHRRVYGLALDSGDLTVYGTPLDDSVVVTTDGDNLVLTLNGEPFEYPSASIDQVQFTTSKHLALLNIGDGATVVDTSHATANDPAGTLVVDSLSIASGGALDLTNNSMVINYGMGSSPADDVRQYLLNGQLISSQASSDFTGLGYADNASFAAPFDSTLSTFAGVTVDTHSVLVKFTYLGDANIDGQVDMADLYRLSQNWLGSGKLWYDGDFNYNGSVNATDLGLLSLNWQAGVGDPMFVDGGGGSDTTDQFITGVSGLGLSSEDVDALLSILGTNAGGPTL